VGSSASGVGVGAAGVGSLALAGAGVGSSPFGAGIGVSAAGAGVGSPFSFILDAKPSMPCKNTFPSFDIFFSVKFLQSYTKNVNARKHKKRRHRCAPFQSTKK
jgi:hypothetical protein